MKKIYEQHESCQDWITARNRSCDFGPLWDRVCCKDGFLMIYRPTRQHLVSISVVLLKERKDESCRS